ncbi:transporter substrate-binding domain-containing protein [Succinivibrio dextrinosolvens]|jgi:putative glutamine transport system substrate-binding protein|uniref:transporter substrate-binding domain-containing protein n=1 Tax=Succinivibrio dextrinosolvens TaxID=83771 RepID=UPI00068ABC18|nr:transporter substrate-binding domain-containing protein [Succinivibrio dextrinosolvens]MBE6422358.1 transporter substrate-binding domain-containing protein [Succinivibrio dextrinosolvens]
MQTNKFSLTVFSCLLGLSLCCSVSADESQLQKIRDNEEFRVAVNNNLQALSIQDENSGEYKGLEPTIANLIAKEIGEDVEVSFIAITPANRESVLESGYADCMIGTYTISEDRKLKYDISSPYFVTNVSLLVNSQSGINSVEDLVGKKIGIILNANSAKELVKYMITKGLIEESLFDESTFKPQNWNDQISFELYESYEAVVDALDKNKIQAFCDDRIILNTFAGEKRKIIKDEFAPQEYGIVTKQDSDLSPFIDGLIRKWHDDGTLESLISENIGN